MKKFRGGKKSKDKKQDKAIALIRDFVIPELKDYVPVVSNGASTGSGTFDVYYPFGMAQGVTSITRIGVSIQACSLHVKMVISNGGITAQDLFQWALIQDDGFNGATLSDASLLYDNTTSVTRMFSGWNTANVTPMGAFRGLSAKELKKRRVKILYDSGLMHLGPIDHTATQTYYGEQNYRVVDKLFKWKKPKIINYVGPNAGVASLGQGNIYILHRTFQGGGSSVILNTQAVFTDV